MFAGGESRTWRLAYRQRPVSSPDQEESGETLIEVLTTVFLLGIAIIGLIGLVFTLVTTSDAHRRRVRSANEATTIVESLQRVDYVPCASPSTPSYRTMLDTAFEGLEHPVPNFELTISGIRYLSDAGSQVAEFDEICPSEDQGVQEITVDVRSPRRSEVTERIVVVKRDTRGDA